LSSGSPSGAVNRTEKRVGRIKTDIPIDRVLAKYGYAVEEGTDREQQFSCDLHGDGTDSKPSARCYPDTNQFYCWACGMSRDAIQLVREKEGVGFMEAMDLLEKQYQLPPMSWEGEEKEETPESLLESILREPPRDTLEIESSRAKRLLDAMTMERAKPLSLVLRLWEQFDYLTVMATTNPNEVHGAMSKLVKRLVEESGNTQ